MESHYKDSLSTAIVHILLQCGFENSSKRALDEFVGLTLNYMRNISSKISNLTSDCNLLESDILIGLGALKLHGDNLDELFNFLHNYNEIFPPQPKIYFGPIPIKHAQKQHEERPLDIVPWAPEMSSALATIGLKLKNNQIVSDPNFDRSKFLALSFKPLSNNNDNKINNSLSQSHTMTNSTVKYGSNCSYQLPPEAYPNKYEPPTIDLDCNGAVVGLNGKSGKLPDPYINDLEEQDILRQKSKFNENQSSKMTFHNQLFNGVRRKQRSYNTDESIQNSPSTKRKVRPESPPVTEQYKSNHVDKAITSEDAWNAALQATVTTITKPDPYALILDSPDHSPIKPVTPVIKKHKKRHRSPSQQRVKKKRRLDNRVEEDVSQIYQNESTMDSRISDDHVPYSSSPERQSNYSYLNNYHPSSQVKDKSPSYSPANDIVPNSISHHHPGSQFAYSSEIIPPQSFLPASKSKKKKSTRKTHFTNKRKKKPLPPPLASNYNFHYKFDHTEPVDNIHVPQWPLVHTYTSHSQTPSPIVSIVDNYVDDSDDDGTEPMKESSEEMLKLLEMSDNNHNEMVDSVVDSPPYSQHNSKHNLTQENSSEGGIRMRIKLCKTNSETNRAGSYVNSYTDLSSPPQSQHSADEKNSISERLNFMRDDSSTSYGHNSTYAKSPDPSHYSGQHYHHQQLSQQQSSHHRPSPSPSSTTQGSYRDDGYQAMVVNSVASGTSAGNGAGSSVVGHVAHADTPVKLSSRTLDALKHHNSVSSHSSPKTLPALDDCDNNKIPPLSFKTAKSSKKRKRSRLSSSSKKTKSKKSSKQRPDIEVPPTPKVLEKIFISVDDVFSDEDDPVKVDHNHLSSPLSATIAQQIHTVYEAPKPPTPVYHTTPQPINKSSPYRLPIPIMKINNRSMTKKSASKSKSKPSQVSAPVILKPVEPKLLYNYSCLQGEAHYESEDGKVVYICPICNTEDNGSLMLLCDLCEDWYHGLCLGIFDEPPEHLEWYCPRCKEDRLSGRVSSSKTKPSKNRTKRK